MTLIKKAYAKINLYLDIISRRPDGYHDIRGVMHKISLHDVVSVTLTPSDETRINITCSVPTIPTDGKNIAYKAAEAYLGAFASDRKKSYTVDIDIEKHIPAAGGLAGGSTDAAAVLISMNDQLALASETQLYALAATLGADVPFCMQNGAMITEGIGERLTPCPSLDGVTVLICNTGESVSTPAAYGMLDRLYGNFAHSDFDRARFSGMLQGLETNDLAAVCGGMYNIFEQAVLCDCPLAKQAKSLMLEYGALGAMMSGSGPTVFGLYEHEQDCAEAYGRLNALGYSVHICTAL